MELLNQILNSKPSLKWSKSPTLLAQSSSNVIYLTYLNVTETFSFEKNCSSCRKLLNNSNNVLV